MGAGQGLEEGQTGGSIVSGPQYCLQCFTVTKGLSHPSLSWLSTGGIYLTLWEVGSPQELRGWAASLLESGQCCTHWSSRSPLYFSSHPSSHSLVGTETPSACVCAEVCVHVLGVHACTQKFFFPSAVPRGPCCLTTCKEQAAESELSPPVHTGDKAALRPRGMVTRLTPLCLVLLFSASLAFASWCLFASRSSPVSNFLYQFLRPGPQGRLLRVRFQPLLP